MKIRALKSISGDYGLLVRGAIDDVNDAVAKKLISAGYAVEVTAEPAESNPVPVGQSQPADEAPVAPAPKKKAKPHAPDQNS